MKIDIITLFPKMFTGPFDESIIKRAIENGLVEISLHDLRKYGTGKHKMVDDKPFGGGKGMLLMVEPIDKALKDIRTKDSHVVLMTPQGKKFSQKKARELSDCKHIILIAGRYEGYDERIRKHLVDEEVSIGDYILTGGELPAMVVAEAVARLIPGVLDSEATKKESFSDESVIEHPQYTRPEDYNGWKAPDVLLSGNHAEIEKWRQKESEKKTQS